ncbi:MAG: LCP family protein [Actinomycetota bacterium]|nr:LCP family protein [Actinomycetota bacterium]
MSPSANLRSGVRACAAAALLSVVLPGAGHLAIRARFRAAVLAAGLLNLLATIALMVTLVTVRDRMALAEIVADRARFIGVGASLVVLACTRLWSALDSAWQARPTTSTALRLAAAFTTALVVVGGVAPLAVAADYVWHTDRALEQVFGTDDAITAYPGSVAPDHETTRNATLGFDPVSPATTTTAAEPPSIVAPTSTRPATTVPATTTTLPPMVAEHRVNVLLLGGDAGPGRWSLRTDSMIVVSIDPVTGDTAMISVPRNLTRLPFPPGTALAQRYPRGFTDIANAVYPIVNQHRELAGGGDDAGAQAVKLGMAQLLGMPIHYYVLVDMRGFVDVVDALGGIDLNVPRRVPSPGNPADAKHDVPAWIEAGQQHMDGTLALTYARSRSADSDYQRMARQRCVLGAIATAATPAALATGVPELVGAFGDAVRTDIPRDRLGEFAQLIDRFSAAGGLQAVRTLHLAPPLISNRSWDALEVRLLVADVISPAPVAANPAPASPAPAPPAPVLTTGC